VKKIIQLGLKENWPQFSLLVAINAFVGGMIGLERSILPEIAATEFHIAAKTAILSFIIVFGITKAISNYFTGRWSALIGRKKLLLIGWLFGIPVPFILMWAGNWNWIIFANILLGINQGITWTSTVMMKIDLVGEKQRGFAMGLNEFAGYIAVAVVAFLTGWIASHYGLRPYPFYIGIFLALSGLFSSFFVKDTRHHVAAEIKTAKTKPLKSIFRDTTWRNPNLSAVTQAGLINNLNDGMVWGIFPIFLALKGYNIEDIAIICAVYPAVWGISQVFTGRLADLLCKRDLLFIGMFLQGIVLVAFLFTSSMAGLVLLAAFLGFGTAVVYPTFLAAIAENTHPSDRSNSMGVFRFWRDLGYAVGAILAGFVADVYNVDGAILLTGMLTIISALVILSRMKCGASESRLSINFKGVPCHL
jgi:MFS family permease